MASSSVIVSCIPEKPHQLRGFDQCIAKRSFQPSQWRSEGCDGGGGGGQMPPGADLRGAPKCLDIWYK